MEHTRLESELFDVGRGLAGALPANSRNPLRAADDKAMELASQDAELKAALFRFVDVVPACRSLDDLARHLTGFLGEVETPPPPVAVAMRMGNTRAGRTALGAAAAAGVKHMAHRFIVGESPRAALGTLRELWKDGVATSVDLLGEATVTQAEAQRYAARCTEALETVAAAARDWPERPALERDSAGVLPRANLSVKVSALTPLLRPDAPDRGKRDAADRLRGLLHRTRDLGAHLHIDMESLDSRDAVLELVLELLAEEEFRAGPSAGMVLQAYLRDARPALRVAIASHNLRSIAHAIAYDRLSGGMGADLELQVLRGLGDPLQHAIVAQGLRVRTYCPVGDLVAGMAYLVRRLLENTSNESFLAEQAKGVPLEQLLAPPTVAAGR